MIEYNIEYNNCTCLSTYSITAVQLNKTDTDKVCFDTPPMWLLLSNNADIEFKEPKRVQLMWTFINKIEKQYEVLSVLYVYRFYCIILYLPTKFSNTELFPALWLPTTAIWGRSKERGRPRDAKASCNLFTIGISCSIPTFPAIFDICFRVLLCWQSFNSWRKLK